MYVTSLHDRHRWQEMNPDQSWHLSRTGRWTQNAAYSRKSWQMIVWCWRQYLCAVWCWGASGHSQCWQWSSCLPWSRRWAAKFAASWEQHLNNQQPVIWTQHIMIVCHKALLNKSVVTFVFLQIIIVHVSSADLSTFFYFLTPLSDIIQVCLCWCLQVCVCVQVIPWKRWTWWMFQAAVM